MNKLNRLKSIGPGIIVVLTWLGPGDIVETTLSGSSYGYALIWTVVVALLARFYFVSHIAKYQLLNPHQEHILESFKNLHRIIPYVIGILALVMGHAYCAYMTLGLAEGVYNLTKTLSPTTWGVILNITTLLLVLSFTYKRAEITFKLLASILILVIIFLSIASGIDLKEIGYSIITLNLPNNLTAWSSSLLALSTIGAIAGSIMNLLYSDYIREKGWIGPEHRKMQMFDLSFSMLIFICLNIALWSLGVTHLHEKGIVVNNVEDMSRILQESIGSSGRVIFYIGIIAAISSSLIGFSHGLAKLAFHGFALGSNRRNWTQYKSERLYQIFVSWCLISPLLWLIFTDIGFISLTIIVNAAQIILLPLISVMVWVVTSKSAFIGDGNTNTWIDHILLAFLTGLSIFGGYQAINSIAKHIA